MERCLPNTVAFVEQIGVYMYAISCMCKTQYVKHSTAPAFIHTHYTVHNIFIEFSTLYTRTVLQQKFHHIYVTTINRPLKSCASFFVSYIEQTGVCIRYIVYINATQTIHLLNDYSVQIVEPLTNTINKSKYE